MAIANSAPVRLVLSTDGTDVDDDEVLEYFDDETLLMLKSDEQWQSLTESAPTSSVPVRPQEHVAEPDPSASATKVQQENYQLENTTMEASASNANGKLGTVYHSISHHMFIQGWIHDGQLGIYSLCYIDDVFVIYQ